MSDGRRPNLLESRGGRRFLFAALYFSEGAPIGFLWWALPTYLRERGIAVDSIGGLSAILVLPWALKFLWAPLVDTLRSPQWSLRAWIIAAQCMMGVMLLPLLFAGNFNNTSLLGICLLAHALFAATQDVSVDALCIANVPALERGAMNGWMQAGFLLGRAAFGGGTLVLLQHFESHRIVALLIAATWSSMILVIWCVRESPVAVDLPERVEPRSTSQRFGVFRESLIAALANPLTWIGLTFAATAGAGFEAIGALAGPFLIDAGVDTDVVGRFFLGPTIGLMLVGALLGGWASDRYGRLLAVTLFTLMIVVAGCAVGAAASSPTPYSNHDVIGVMGLKFWHHPIMWSMSFLYFGIGLFTASSYALLMDLTDAKLGATQFSAFMGATNLCEAWAAFAGGALVARCGYPTMFFTMSCATLIALPILFAMKSLRRVSNDSG